METSSSKLAKKHRRNRRKAKMPPPSPGKPVSEGFTLPSPSWPAKKVLITIRPTASDLETDEAVWALYRRWCRHYNICRTIDAKSQGFDIFKGNANLVFQMNQIDPTCQFHLSSSCDEKDLFDPSGAEEMTPIPTKSDYESDEAVLDLYYRWCLYHKILRTPEEMQQRVKYFKMSAIHSVEINQKDPLSIWCDKIDLCYWSEVRDMKTLAPTEGDLKSDKDLRGLYTRWCLHHKILRTPEEMQVRFDNFKKSATKVFEMSQKDPTIQYLLSFGCDETERLVPEVTLIPTERDFTSGNDLLGLYHRYCLYYKICRTPEEMKQRFSNFKKSVDLVFEKNKDSSCQFYLSSFCDEKDLLAWAAKKVLITIRPTASDLESDEAVWALYRRWCHHYNICRTIDAMSQGFDIFKENAKLVLQMNEMDPSCQYHLSSSCDEKDLFEWSDAEDMTPTPTESDLESDEAVLDLYCRWCLYYKILRTPEEMQQRVKYFKMSAVRALEMNQKDPLSMWCDKIDLRSWSDVEHMETLAPTEGELESDTDSLDLFDGWSDVKDMKTLAPTEGDFEPPDKNLWNLYDRWRSYHKIHRTPTELRLRFDSFKKSATKVFEMSQKDPAIQYLLSFGCDDTDLPVPDVTVIPTERDLKSGNALLALYYRYCLHYKIHRTPEEMKQRFSNFKKRVNFVFEKNKKDPSFQFCLAECCDREELADKKVLIIIRPTASDLKSDVAVWALYRRWCLHCYDTHRTPRAMCEMFHVFKRNANLVFRMNQMDPSCQFHLSSFCDEKDLFDRYDVEEKTPAPTKSDLESDEAVLDLYYRWCLYHKILRTPEEMKQRVKYFKMSAIRALEMNQNNPLSIWCDIIDLRYWSDDEDMTITPTKEDLESNEALMDLYHRWCFHHKIWRTAREMQLRFDNFKKSATQVFEMSKKDPNVQYLLSFGCDETDQPVPEVTVIPTERDLKSGNALLCLYHRYCFYYKTDRTDLEIMERFSNFKKSVDLVFEKNKDPSCQFYLSSFCDEKDSLDLAAKKVLITIRPTASDLESDETVLALYRRWCHHYNMCRTIDAVGQGFDIFKDNAKLVFQMNNLDSCRSVFQMNELPTLRSIVEKKKVESCQSHQTSYSKFLQSPSCQFHLSSSCQFQSSSCLFHLSSSCDEKDLFEGSDAEDMTPTPTKSDLESDEAVLDLYYRWCLYYKILRTPKEMLQRVKCFRMSAVRALEMNQKDPLPIWSDKIDLRYWSDAKDMKILAPTERDLKSKKGLKALYERFRLHHKIHRTAKEISLRFDSFKKNATQVYEMSQKDTSIQYLLSFGCDETDEHAPNVSIIPTERDIKSGNALLGLYHRFCLYYKRRWIPEEMKKKFIHFQKSVNYVLEKNKKDPSRQFCLAEYCDAELDDIDMANAAAAPVVVTLKPTASDVKSDDALRALYRRWCLVMNMHRTRKERTERFKIFKQMALYVFHLNKTKRDSYILAPWSDEKNHCCIRLSCDAEGSSSKCC